MNFRELQYISAIAKSGTISRAAETLFISQPTLSRFLRNQEAMLGVQLFVRINGRMIPTYYCERYLHYANEILKINIQMEQELSDISQEEKGRLRIASPRNRFDGLVMASFLRFKDQFPGIDLIINEQTNQDREKLLLNGEVDLAFVFSKNKHPELIYEPLLQENIVLCISPNHKYANQGMIRPDFPYPWINLRKFADENFIVQSQNRILGSITMEIFKSSNIAPNILMETVSPSSMLEAINHGFACGFLLDSYLHFLSLNPSPLLFSFGNSQQSITLCLAYHADRYLSKHMKEYIKITQSIIQERYHL